MLLNTHRFWCNALVANAYRHAALPVVAPPRTNPLNNPVVVQEAAGFRTDAVPLGGGRWLGRTHHPPEAFESDDAWNAFDPGNAEAVMGRVQRARQAYLDADRRPAHAAPAHARLLLPVPAFLPPGSGERRRVRHTNALSAAKAATGREVGTDADIPPQRTVTRALRIPMFPTACQRHVLRGLVAASDRAYNAVVEAAQRHDVSGSNTALWNRIVTAPDRVGTRAPRQAGARTLAAEAARCRRQDALPAERRAARQAAEATRQDKREREAAVIRTLPGPTAGDQRVPREIRHAACRQAGAALENPQACNHRRRGHRDVTGTVVLPGASLKPDGSGGIHDTGPLRAFRAHPDRPGRPGGTRRWAQFQLRSARGHDLFAPDTANGGWIAIRDRTTVIDRLLADGCLRQEGRLRWDRRLDRWHLIVTVTRPVAAAAPPPRVGAARLASEAFAPACRVVALDPGVRAFQTFYDPTGRHGELLCNLAASAPEPPAARTAVALARRRLADARETRTPADRAHWRTLRDLLARQGAAQTGSWAEWTAARDAVRVFRASHPLDEAARRRRNAVRRARRGLARAQARADGRVGLQASLERQQRLRRSHRALADRMAAEEHALHHAKDARSLRRWRARAHREQVRRDAAVADAHYAAARFLLDRYDAVVCPRWASGPESSAVARSMQHHRFRQRLISAAEGHADRKMVWLFHEPGTTRHCGHCGAWHAALTLADREYRCPTCQVRLGRDVNGARNNLLAPLTALLTRAPQFLGQPQRLDDPAEEQEERMLDDP